MPIKKLNLTQVKVNQELAKVAKNHPSSTYRILLNNPQFRQELLDYILKKINHEYLVVESSEDLCELIKTINCNTHEKTQIHNLIDQRINELRVKRTFSHPSVDVNWKSYTHPHKTNQYQYK